MRNYEKMYDSIYMLMRRSGSKSATEFHDECMQAASTAVEAGEVRSIEDYMDTAVYDYTIEAVALRLVEMSMIQDIATNSNKRLLVSVGRGKCNEEETVANEIKSMNRVYNKLVDKIKSSLPVDIYERLPICHDDMSMICEQCDTVNDLTDIMVTEDGSFT